MKIGFIGLGNMGAPMAANLAKAGYDVSGFDIADVAVEGVLKAQSVAETVRGKDVVVTMMPNGAIVRQLYEEIIAALDTKPVFLDCSTISVADAKAAAELAKAAGCSAVDAPVSGGTKGAEAGTLTFMAGGDEASFETVKPLLDVMGQKAVLCGGNGAGQAAKICNNMLLAISMIGASEAFALAQRLELDPAKLFDVISTSSGSCWSVNTYCPVPGVGPQSPADNEYRPGFASALMLKDLRLAMRAADDAGAHVEMGKKAAELYENHVENGRGDEDFSSIIKYL